VVVMVVVVVVVVLLLVVVVVIAVITVAVDVNLPSYRERVREKSVNVYICISEIVDRHVRDKVFVKYGG
jgi:biopolymer transport protein ExbD